MIARYAAGAAGARAAARSGATVVVVDAFRASTSICLLVSRGVLVTPVADLEQAAHFVADYRIGERGSAKVKGFDFGNSPTELAGAELRAGATAVLSTTNGTRVLRAAEAAPVVLTGAFVNAGAVAEMLLDVGHEVVVVGCGWEGKRALEDELAAGSMLHRLADGGVELDPRARAVADMYRGRPITDALKGSAARRLRRLNHAADLNFCLREDSVPVVPRLIRGTFQRFEFGARVQGPAGEISRGTPEMATRVGGT